MLAAVSVLGTLFAGFAIRAAQVTYNNEAPLLAARLRRFIVVIAVLGLVLVAIGLLDGQLERSRDVRGVSGDLLRRSCGTGAAVVAAALNPCRALPHPTARSVPGHHQTL